MPRTKASTPSRTANAVYNVRQAVRELEYTRGEERQRITETLERLREVVIELDRAEDQARAIALGNVRR